MPTMTAEQKRITAKAEFDVYLSNCPSRRLLDRIADKWVMLVVTALDGGSMRFSELAGRIAGVSQKMLTQTLRSLERDGLVTRTVTPSVPVRVDYELTPLGRSLLQPIAHIKGWAEAHMPEVDLARAAYDDGSERSAGSR
jgi:DNA-binding HxlR family transcriptional regulator